MKRGYKNLIFYLIITATSLSLPAFVFAQTATTTTDSLVKEYLLPIRSYQEIGAIDVKKGAECDSAKLYDDEDYTACLAINNEGDIKKIGNGYLEVDKPAMIKYKLSVKEAGSYMFKIQTANLADNFANLKTDQVDYILNQAGINGLGQLLSNIKEGNALIADPDFNKLDIYGIARSMIFSVYVNGTRKGFIVVKATDANTMVQDGSLVLGNLAAGDQEVELRLLNDAVFNFSAIIDLPSYLDNFSNVDLNKDKKLDLNPIIFSSALVKVQPTDDVIGIRIYTNKTNKYPAVWYFDNVINPNSSIETTTMDGYQAVKDGRTIYASAANLPQICVGGNNATFCTTDNDCGGGQCKLQSPITDIYVIAYNENAAPTTLQIYNLMVENFNLNTNLKSEYPANYALKKGQLRRDTIRKADLTYINQLLATYHQNKGKFPTLEAGTFVKAHTISTWPSWQTALGGALGAGLPSDPLNVLSVSAQGQNDCTGEKYKTADCATICSRDTAGATKTGCKANEQCIGDQYCSICPLGYDAATCWDQTKLKFAFGLQTGCNISSLDGSFNLGGTPCLYDGAFAYQYTSIDSGKKYLLNYRLEYETSSTCQPGECYINDHCFRPGECVGNLKYCLAGSAVDTCGDGFLQTECSEECDGNLGIDNVCTLIPDILPDGTHKVPNNHNWYKPQKGSCTKDCKLVPPETVTAVSCGGYCGDSFVQKDNGETCDNNTAYCINCRCVPNCKGMCGGASDGCGGKCNGLCGTGQVCNSEKRCVQQNCDCNGHCGQYGSCACGACAGGKICDAASNKCLAPAPTACTCGSKVCGDNGCGGSCGVCGIGTSCNGSKCVYSHDSCQTTCVKEDADKKIYPCGDNGCGQKGACGSCGGYGAAWRCNPLLGRCQCYIAPTDPSGCEATDRCGGTDICGRPCLSSCASGPCATAGSYTNGNVENPTPDQCIDCSALCKIFAAGDCFDSRQLVVTGLPSVSETSNYQVLKALSTSDSFFGTGDSIRFVDDDDKNHVYHFYKESCDNTPLGPQPGKLCYWINIDNYTSDTKTIDAISSSKINDSTSYSYNRLKDYASSADNTFELFDDFSGSNINTDKWTVLKGDGVSVTINASKQLDINGSDTGPKYEWFGVRNAKQIQKNTLVKVDFAENTPGSDLPKDWKSVMGLNGYSLNSEIAVNCCWDGDTSAGCNGGKSSGQIQCWSARNGTDKRYVSRWVNMGDCPDAVDGNWWVCDAYSKFQNYNTPQSHTIYTRLDNDGNLIYSEDNLTRMAKLDSPGTQKIWLNFGPDMTGAWFSATFDNLVARKYVNPEPTVSDPSASAGCGTPTVMWKCDSINNTCVEDDAAGTYTSSDCNGECAAAETCKNKDGVTILTISSSQTLSNYQVKFANTGNSTTLDIEDDTCTPLSYWIDTSVSPHQVWVKVPSIASDGSTKIYVNSGTNMPNPYTTFDYYDNFNEVNNVDPARAGSYSGFWNYWDLAGGDVQCGGDVCWRYLACGSNVHIKLTNSYDDPSNTASELAPFHIDQVFMHGAPYSTCGGGSNRQFVPLGIKTKTTFTNNFRIFSKFGVNPNWDTSTYKAQLGLNDGIIGLYHGGDYIDYYNPGTCSAADNGWCNLSTSSGLGASLINNDNMTNILETYTNGVAKLYVRDELKGTRSGLGDYNNVLKFAISPDKETTHFQAWFDDIKVTKFVDPEPTVSGPVNY
jgi:hypothetical protein